MRKSLIYIIMVLLIITSCNLIKQKPEAQNVHIVGTAKNGHLLQGEYQFVDPSGHPEGNSLFQWYRADSSAGEDISKIGGATDRDYIVESADVGKQLIFEVTPVNSKGTRGDPVLSSPTAAVEAGPALFIPGKALSTVSECLISVWGSDLDSIELVEVVLEYDEEYFEWDGFSATSRIGGILIAKKPSDSLIHIAISGFGSVSIDNKELIRITLDSKNKTGTTEITFTTYISEGGVFFKTGLIPVVEDLDLSNHGIFVIE